MSNLKCLRLGGEGSLCTTHVNENWGAIIIKPVKRSTIKIRVHTEGQPQRATESLYTHCPTLLLSLTLSFSLSFPLYLHVSLSIFLGNISAPELGAGCWALMILLQHSHKLMPSRSLSLPLSPSVSLLKELLVHGAEAATAAPKMKHVAFAL